MPHRATGPSHSYRTRTLQLHYSCIALVASSKYNNHVAGRQALKGSTSTHHSPLVPLVDTTYLPLILLGISLARLPSQVELLGTPTNLTKLVEPRRVLMGSLVRVRQVRAKAMPCFE